MRKDPLKPSLEKYKKTGNINDLLEGSYNWIIRNARYLQNDPDVASDFAVYFIERLPAHVERFHKNPVHFTGFLKKALHYDFMNFIRSLRRKQEFEQHQTFIERMHADRPAKKRFRTESLQTLIAGMPAEVRISIRLKYCLPLSIDDLMEIAARSGIQKAGSVAAWFQGRHNSEECVFEPRITYNSRVQKSKPLTKQQDPSKPLSLEIVAGLLSLSRSATARRIRTGIRILRNNTEFLLEKEPENEFVYDYIRYRAG